MGVFSSFVDAVDFANFAEPGLVHGLVILASDSLVPFAESSLVDVLLHG